MEVVVGVAAFVDKYREDGKCKEIYTVPGLKMTVSIWEAESAEDLDRLFLEWPMFAFADVEVYTLADFDTHTKTVKEM
jgi:muconolactone delta-isomerase